MATWVLSRPSGSFFTQPDTDLAVVSAALADTPGDFGTASAVSIAATAGAVYTLGWDNDSYGVECRIMSGATVLAAADSGGSWVPVQGLSSDWSTAKEFPAIAFAYVNTSANAALWDAAEVQYRQRYSKVKKVDNGYIVLAAGVSDITVTYIGAPITADLAATLGELTLVSAGVLPVVGDVNVTLTDAVATIVGKVSLGGDLSVTLGALTMSGDGTVAVPPGTTGNLNVTLGALTLSADGSGPRTADLAVTLGALTLEATAVTGVVVGYIHDEAIH